MNNQIYPRGTVPALLNSDEVNVQTKAVLNDRIKKTERIQPSFFTIEIFALLEAVCAVLFPQEEGKEKIPLAILYEDSLSNGKGKGWRYNQMPPLKAAITQGLKGIEGEAQHLHQYHFTQLSPANKEFLLTNIQQGKAVSDLWRSLPSNLFFEELLASLTELYYSHPIAKDVIGDVSFSDAKGWTHLGLNKLENREPKPFKTISDAGFS